MKTTLLQKIQEDGFMSKELRQKYFKGKKVQEVRDWLQSNGINRHFPIEYLSTEVAVITPDGILLQVRATDNDYLGVWGGMLEDGETPIEGAIRELFEETHIPAQAQDLKFVGLHEHSHVYANGDAAKFVSYQYVMHLDSCPEIFLDSESDGFKLVNASSFSKLSQQILPVQLDFIRSLLH